MNITAIEQLLSSYESANRRRTQAYRAPGHTPVEMDWIMPGAQFCKACSADAKSASAVHCHAPTQTNTRRLKNEHD